jgi:glycosyltransferase involved in cell wall biosynthesis
MRADYSNSSSVGAPRAEQDIPRILIVGRTRIRLPLEESMQLKFEALSQVARLRVVASAPEDAPTGDETFELVAPARPRILDGLLFRLRLPLRVARELTRFKPDAVIVEGAHDTAAVLVGRQLARSDAPVVADLHGDWRQTLRLYGSPLRRLAAPVADLVAKLALRRADGVRTLSPATTELVREEAGVEPKAEFPAFMDLEPFLGPPVALPERPRALFVGVLELYKNVDGLAEAWRLAAPLVPGAELRIVGRGPRHLIVEELIRDVPGRTSWVQHLDASDIAAELDRATALVLPSRSEGLPRVAVEALCRGRPVIGTNVGGIPDLIHDGENGLLVEPEDPQALAEALVQVLSDWVLAAWLAAHARSSAEPWLATPEEYADNIRELIAALD